METINFPNSLDFQTDLNSFYKNLNNTDFEEVDVLELLDIKERAKKLNEFFTNKISDCLKFRRYIKILNTIKTNPKYKCQSKAGYYYMLMFAIDPNLEIAKIHIKNKDLIKSKLEIKQNFGLYDPYILKVEKEYIKRMSKSKENQKCK